MCEMNQRNMRLCLYQSCVGAFFKTNQYRIFRDDPLEVIKEPCDVCHVRRGYEFVIKPQRRSKIASFIPATANSAYSPALNQ